VQELEHSRLLRGELSFRMRMRSTSVLHYNFGCRTRQAGIMERVLNAGGQENLNSCGHLPSSMKTLFSEKIGLLHLASGRLWAVNSKDKNCLTLQHSL
jgi:hypothetical protein